MERFKLSLASRERIGIAAVVLMLVFLGGGLIKLQVLEYATLAKQSENNRIRVVPIIPRRGTIFDREGRVIVDNRPSYTVSVVPAEQVPGVTVPNLAQLIDLDTTEIRRRIVKNTVSRYQPAAVMKDIPFEMVAVLEEQHDIFPGVSYQMERVRQYADSLGAEVFTGHVNEISKDELAEQTRTDVRPGSMVGKKGIERAFDRELRGIEGTAYIEVYASGQILGPYAGRARVEATPGADLTLTIDVDVQRTCLHALDTFCCGAVVAMDPRSGEILALTSYPSYDANIFSSVISDSLWRAISTDSTHPLLNRPVTGQYPPGSTTKLITVGAGLERGLITANSTFKPCLGGYRFGNRVFHCWDLGGHGTLTAVHALEESCDIYMYQLGLQLGVDGLSEYFEKCGFGRVTGIEIGGEVAGLNPSSAYYDRRYGENQWTRALVMNNSIGQGEILATPLQLTQFYCGLANEGVVYRPHLVKRITRPDGSETVRAPERSFVLPFSSDTRDLLLEGLRLVVEGEHGTARSLRNERYSIGGKTGTAQNPHGLEHSLFVGVAPLESPEIVVCAIIENAGHGSEVAAPVVGAVIESYMNKRLGIDTLTVADAGEGE
jgi:penicillin-binding protein 2